MTAPAPDWRGDSDERLTPDVLRWFRERVRYELVQAALLSKPPVPEHLALALESRFTSQPDYYLLWVPDEQFQLSRWDDEDRAHVPGAWAPRKRFRQDVDYLVGSLAAGLAVEQALAPQPIDGCSPVPTNCPVVPPADVDKALQELSEPATLRESSGEAVLRRRGAHDQANALREAQRRLERRLEHKCDCCGAWHQRRAGQPHVYRCEDCRAAKRKPCWDCQQPFTPDKAQRRRCPTCREGGKAGAR